MYLTIDDIAKLKELHEREFIIHHEESEYIPSLKIDRIYQIEEIDELNDVEEPDAEQTLMGDYVLISTENEVYPCRLLMFDNITVLDKHKAIIVDWPLA